MEQKLLLSPSEICTACSTIGQGKASLSRRKMLLLGIFAGMFIAFAGVGATFANIYVNKLAGACVFPAGLAMVLLAGSELFTGNSLMLVPLLKKKITLRSMLRSWLFVYIGNCIGAFAVAAACVYAGSFDAIGDTVIATAAAKATLTPAAALLRGILCNVLVCIAVWMSFGAKTASGKIAAMFFPIMVFVLSGFEHSVANMFYLPAGLLMQLRTSATVTELTVSGALLSNLLPVTIGNVIGGAGVVGLGYYLAYGRQDRV